MVDINQMPKEEGLDHTIALKREGYRFITNRARRFQSDVFKTRIIGEEAICLVGAEGAQIFYDEEHFHRAGAAPKRAQKTLFGVGGVQGLDGKERQDRKAMLMSVMGPESLKELGELTQEAWDQMSRRWETMEEIVLYDEAQRLLFQVACQWAGVPIEEDKLARRVDETVQLFESPAAIGIQHWQGRLSRGELERWIRGLVEDVRAEQIEVPMEGALYKFSVHRGFDGRLLDGDIVAVEVLNILRPVTAVAVYIAFLGHALHEFPEAVDYMEENGVEGIHNFVQEVRRFYPFFPFAPARVARDFTWRGFLFAEGTLTLLDLYGTNHDERIWEGPDRFEPSRFEGREIGAFEMIPQGGGDHLLGHRCAGEWATIKIMEESLDFLANQLEYEVPEQDLNYSMNEMPSRPHSGVILRGVERRRVH